MLGRLPRQGGRHTHASLSDPDAPNLLPPGRLGDALKTERIVLKEILR